MTILQKIIHSRLIPDITIRRKSNGLIFYFSLRDNLAYLLRPNVLNDEEIPQVHDSLVWDIGCNVGLHTIPLAQQGNKVVSVDISSKALDLLLRSAVANGLTHRISTYFRVFSLNPKMKVYAASSAWTENKTVTSAFGTVNALTPYQLAKYHGIPRHIKMDIEGDEWTFLKNKKFMEWIKKHKITFDVSRHLITR